MKVGDLVRQSGSLVSLEARTLKINTERLGVIVKIETNEKPWPKKFEEWKKWLGGGVTVLWSNGRMNRVAGRALEVVDENR